MKHRFSDNTLERAPGEKADVYRWRLRQVARALHEGNGDADALKRLAAKSKIDESSLCECGAPLDEQRQYRGTVPKGTKLSCPHCGAPMRFNPEGLAGRELPSRDSSGAPLNLMSAGYVRALREQQRRRFTEPL